MDSQLSQAQQSNIQLHIGELAQASGAKTKTFRHYEDAGLMPLAQNAENGCQQVASFTCYD